MSTFHPFEWFSGRLAIVAITVWLAGCIRPQSEICSTGVVCPVGLRCAAYAPVCINTPCGNGVPDPGEMCDDGNISGGDGCSADCRSNERCGNGIIDTSVGEFCDDGNTNNGDGCSADCRSGEGCGNGQINPGEQCDPGPPASGTEPVDTAACDRDCTRPACGDGIANTLAGEACDPGAAGETDTCNFNCTLRQCGDGIVNGSAGEECDEGAETSTCNANCTVARCGDGVVNDTAGEDCDEGGETTTCNANCTAQRCGDGILNLSASEECDEGGETSLCNVNCTLARCGDGIVNSMAGETCEIGSANETAACNYNCTDADCGDGIVNAAAGEQCDNLGGGYSPTCDNDCSIAYCGDGQINPMLSETCDPGDDGESATCNANCTAVRCGDGVINVAAGEQCDTPGGGYSPGCNADCTVSYCGDGKTNTTAGEQCDDGNPSNLDGCLANCRNNTCGDGFRNPSAEACDDNNNVTETNCPYGIARCTLCNSDCSQALQLTGGFCGDRIVNGPAGGPNEACDDGNNVTETECVYGVESCAYCNADCSQPLAFTGRYCGDGIVSDGEQCDTSGAGCGTCGDDCVIDAIAAAVGSIRVVDAVRLRDGETITLSDGRGPPITFEFDLDGSPVAPGHEPVVLQNSDPADMVAQLLADAINRVGPAPPNPDRLGVTATHAAGAVTVTLENDVAGADGNQPIYDTVLDPGLVVQGMRDGIGLDCPVGAACISDDDCQSTNCNTGASSPTCRP